MGTLHFSEASPGQLAVALTALSLYKPAAASIRTLIETALYYSFFRSHPTELSTLIRTPAYYVDKRQIIEFHSIHNPNFKSVQAHVGLLQRMEETYGGLSAIIHGQIPGAWTQLSIKKLITDPKMKSDVLLHFAEAEEIVYRLFLCTVAPLFWSDFSTAAKKALTKGLHAETRLALEIDVG